MASFAITSNAPASLPPATTLLSHTATAFVSTAEFTSLNAFNNHSNHMNTLRHAQDSNPRSYSRDIFINGLPFENTAFPNLAEKLGFRQ
ncbi:hypothetical protein HDU77_002437 [Chytriomyces hyalinus]|nr:hypothetical protein HDU77_002437 [Chytriomyces hyalinus]